MSKRTLGGILAVGRRGSRPIPPLVAAPEQHPRWTNIRSIETGICIKSVAICALQKKKPKQKNPLKQASYTPALGCFFSLRAARTHGRDAGLGGAARKKPRITPQKPKKKKKKKVGGWKTIHGTRGSGRIGAGGCNGLLCTPRVSNPGGTKAVPWDCRVPPSPTPRVTYWVAVARPPPRGCGQPGERGRRGVPRWVLTVPG